MKNVHKMDICRASDSFLGAMGHIIFFLRLVSEQWEQPQEIPMLS